jgi:hypothetical protein
VRDAARERADGLQLLGVAQLRLEHLALLLRRLAFEDLVLEPSIDADELAAHRLQIHRELADLQQAAVDAQSLSILAEAIRLRGASQHA